MFLSDSCDGGEISGLDPGGGSPDNLFVDGGSGETRKFYRKGKTNVTRNHSYVLIKYHNTCKHHTGNFHWMRTSQILDYLFGTERYPILSWLNITGIKLFHYMG